MKQSTAARKEGRRHNGFFPLVACLLLIITLTGLFLRLSPGGEVARAWEKTAKALAKKEEAPLFLLTSLQDSTVEVRGDSLSLDYNAQLPRELSLSVKENDLTLGFYAAGDTVTLKSPQLLEGAYSAGRGGNAAAFSQSVFAREPVKKEHTDLLRLLLALSDPALFDDELGDGMKNVWKKASPETSSSPLEGRGTVYTYTINSQGLVKGLNELCSLGKEEAFQNAALARLSLISACLGRDVTPEEEAALRAFLSGTGEAFNTFSALVGKSDSTAQIYFSVSEGYLLTARLEWKLGDYRGEAYLNLEDPNGTPALTAFTLSVTKAEEEYLSASAGFEVTDDSEMALIREATLSLTDKSGILLPAEEPTASLTLRYSWGKEKGDLGLRIITPEKEINLRGALSAWKPGKRLEFRLKRLEVGGKNLLTQGELAFSILPGGKPEAAPEANGALFPEGEERETLRLLLETHYPELFGGTA